MLPEATMICQAFYCALLRPIYIRFAPYCAYLIVFAHAIRAAIINLRAAAPAADPGKMGKEETARLTFPICVCRVVYVCLYVYTLSSLCSLLYNIASLQTKKQASRKNVFFPTFSAFSISHQLTCCCCCC